MSEIEEILRVIKKYPDGIGRGELNEHLSFQISGSTLYRRLSTLLKEGKIQKIGVRNWTKYCTAQEPILDSYENKPSNTIQNLDSSKGKIVKDISSNSPHIFTPSSIEILNYLNNPLYTRKLTSYNFKAVDKYKPNETFYLPENIRKELGQHGKRLEKIVPAGTYARHILNRLLIDLSYNSSRLEGNTYSELDTQILIEKSITAEGKVHEETVMIMNHKEAISFLVENADDIDLTPFTIRNIHNLLSQDLLANSRACGNIREIEVNIAKSTYKPISGYLILKENLELLLLKAKKIENSFEQSFFLLLHLSYLQAFEDVNKRTARLACNIPFIKMNQCPLSFTGLPREDYILAMVIFYELNDCNPMIDVFRWSYLKSCERYDLICQNVGNIDEFRVRKRKQRKDCIGEVIRSKVNGQKIENFVRKYCIKNTISQEDRFVAMIITELDTLHIGAIVGTGVSESQFNKWQEEESKNKK